MGEVQSRLGARRTRQNGRWRAWGATVGVGTVVLVGLMAPPAVAASPSRPGSQAPTTALTSRASQATGTLAITLVDVPSKARVSITVTGPRQTAKGPLFKRVLTQTSHLTRLVPGAYKVKAPQTSVSGGVVLGSPSSRSVSVTPGTTTKHTITFRLVKPPSVPQSVAATPGDSQATVAWDAPAATNGAAVSGYTVTAWLNNRPLNNACRTTTQLFCTVTGLANGTGYVFKVVARNLAGSSTAGVTGPADGGVVVPRGTGDVKKVSMGGGGCALTRQADTPVKCWPAGDGHVAAAVAEVLTGTPMGTKVVDIAHHGHTCAVLSTGGVRCWGNNWAGELGNGTKESSQTPVTVPGITTAKSVSAGFHRTCVVLVNGTIKCWGYNPYGELGNGTGGPEADASSTVPVTVTGITTATSIDTGTYNTCARLTNGTVKCWGLNDGGQLGIGTHAPSTYSSVPVAVIGLKKVLSVSVGGTHACAVIIGGSMKCWGAEADGSLGNGSHGVGVFRDTPVNVQGMQSAVAAEAGDHHTCAVLANRAVKCWGLDYYGEVGDGESGFNVVKDTPVEVSGHLQGTGIAAGEWVACAIVGNGVKCWGKGGAGELGNGVFADSSVPVDVKGL